MVTKCSSCKCILEEKEHETFCLCKGCNRFTAKGANFNITKLNGGKDMTARTLKCSVCGTEKKAGKKRLEKWKDKEYTCRDCRKKQKKQSA